MKPSLPILSYRNISPVCGIVPSAFRTQLEWLTEHGWTSVSLSKGVDYLKGATELPPKSYALLFEDCYLDNWVHAAPVLREFGVHAAFGCVTAYLHDGPCRPDSKTPGADLRALPVARDAWRNAIERNDPSAFMNRIELRILVEEQGHELVGHTHTHQACFRATRSIGRVQSGLHPGVHGIYLELHDGLPMYPSGSAYAHDGFWPGDGDPLAPRLIARDTAERIEFCLSEFTLCRERIEEITGKAARVMAWPWGEYDSVAIEAAVLAGYEAAVSHDTGPNHPGSGSLFALRRIRMQGGETVKELRRRLAFATHPVLSLFGRHSYSPG